MDTRSNYQRIVDDIRADERHQRRTSSPAPVPVPPEAEDLGLTHIRELRVEEPPGPRLLWRTLDTVAPEAVTWLWPGRIPLGKLTVVDGDPGLGKSTMLLDLAARVTTGRPMPDGTPTDRGTLLLATAEDGIADTVRPRFDVAGGDAHRLVVIDGVAASEERPLCLPDDVALLRAELATRQDVRLIIIDPFMAYLSGFVNSRIDHDVRRTLAPLAQMAAESGVAIVLVRHLNKSPGGSAVYRGGGSIGIIGAARAGLLVAADPADEQRRVLAPTKSNLAPPAASLIFQLASTSQGVARVEWLGVSPHRADALVAVSRDPEERGELDEAGAFLLDFLADGERTSKEVEREAKAAGISDATLRRAKHAAGVESGRMGGVGGRGVWVWRLRGSIPRSNEPLSGSALESATLLRRSMSPLDEPLSTNEPLSAPYRVPFPGDGE